jgi:hypothetical protein
VQYPIKKILPQVIKCRLKFSNKRELSTDIDQRNLAYREAMFGEN